MASKIVQKKNLEMALALKTVNVLACYLRGHLVEVGWGLRDG